MKKLVMTLVVLVSMVFSISAMAEPRLQWNPSTGATGYIIYGADSAIGVTQTSPMIQKDVGNVTIYPLAPLNSPEGVEYQFVVSAYNESGESGLSNVVSWTRPADEPPPPVGEVPGVPVGLSAIFCFTDIIGGESWLNLSWSASSGEVSGYKIHYGASPGEYSGFVDVGNVTSHESSLDNADRWYFVVTSYNSIGESEESNEVFRQWDLVPMDTTSPPPPPPPPVVDLLAGAGAFSRSAGWSVGYGWSITGGVAKFSGSWYAGQLNRLFDAVVGEKYRVSYEVVAYTSGSLSLAGIASSVKLNNAIGTHSVDVVCKYSAALSFRPSRWKGSLDNVTVEKID